MVQGAIALLNSVGISGATLKAIGEEAGYSRGLATHHFGSKAGLFRSLLREIHAEFLNELEERVGERTGLEALEAANLAHRDYVLRHRDRLRAMYILWFGALDPGSDFKPNVARFMARQRERMAGWIRGGQAAGQIPDTVDADRVATQIYGNLTGVNLQWLIDASLDLTEAYADMRADMHRLLSPT